MLFLDIEKFDNFLELGGHNISAFLKTQRDKALANSEQQGHDTGVEVAPAERSKRRRASRMKRRPSVTIVGLFEDTDVKDFVEVEGGGDLGELSDESI